MHQCIPGCHILPKAGSPWKAPWLLCPTGSRPGISWPLGWMVGCCSAPVDSFWAIHACARAAQSTWPAQSHTIKADIWLDYIMHVEWSSNYQTPDVWEHPQVSFWRNTASVLRVHHHSLTWILLVLERLHPLLLAQRPLRPGLSSLIPHLSSRLTPEMATSATLSNHP